MIVQNITRVFLDPVAEFDDYMKFRQDDRWTNVSTNTVLATYERTEYNLESTVDDLLKKEQ